MTPLGLESKKYMDASQTVPDEIFLDLVDKHLHKQVYFSSGWILDGFPHTKSQAEKLRDREIIPDKVLFLELPRSAILERAKFRWIDPLTGKEITLVYLINAQKHAREA